MLRVFLLTSFYTIGLCWIHMSSWDALASSPGVLYFVFVVSANGGPKYALVLSILVTCIIKSAQEGVSIMDSGIAVAYSKLLNCNDMFNRFC